ncbi:MAG: cyclic di-GMP phosphodiesterase [Clostridiales bacterium]|nr:cyclic di-GMP phosphodiesterase [Clostridiales bacterium]
MKAKILIVDDSSTDRMMIASMLEDYEVFTAADGIEAMEILHQVEPDLMILDLNMPRMDGFAVLKKLQEKTDYQGIKTIILTNSDEIESEILGLKMGAVDYIRKPINIAALSVRILIHLKLKESQKIIEQDKEELEELVKVRTQELERTRDITIHALIGLLEVRNIESSNHTIRTQKLMKLLCEHLKTKEKYQNLLTEHCIQQLVATTPLHDIGKVGIPDDILLKPGRLSEEEFERMKQHVDYGVRALKNALYCEDEMPDFIKTAIDIVQSHHEKYDGSGYPRGLAGEDIPLFGRLMSIIDVYDAMVNKRVYKPAYEHLDCLDYIQSHRGSHFDPEIVDAFTEIWEQVLEVYKKDQENT